MAPAGRHPLLSGRCVDAADPDEVNWAQLGGQFSGGGVHEAPFRASSSTSTASRLAASLRVGRFSGGASALPSQMESRPRFGPFAADQSRMAMRSKIMPLDDDVRVLPGHGPETTIGSERSTNPFRSYWQ